MRLREVGSPACRFFHLGGIQMRPILQTVIPGEACPGLRSGGRGPSTCRRGTRCTGASSWLPSFAGLTARSLRAAAAFLFVLLSILPSHAADLRELINGLADKSYAETEKQIAAIVANDDVAGVPALEALAEGDLYARKSDGVVFITAEAESGFALTDPITG